MTPAFLLSDQQRVEHYLAAFLHHYACPVSELQDAMSYSILLGGKRVRPSLVYRCGALLGASMDDLDAAAAALEAMHCYSLIHDDLPAMDNDALRRGKPTCHVAFGEATAILAGDAVQSLAFELLSSHNYQHVSSARVVDMVRTLARQSGALGMCAGQALDLAHTNRRFSSDTLEQMHRMKTGALMQCAVELAYYTSPVNNPAHLQLLQRFAASLGLAFQVQDDILDIESDTETLGKPQGSDHLSNKATYPSLLGIAEARNKARQLYQDAIQALEQLPYPCDDLKALAQFLIARKN